MKLKIKELSTILVIALLTMSAMNISPALNSISSAYPEASDESIQLLVSLPSFTVIISSLLTGWLASRISKKKILLVCSAVFVVVGCSPILINGLIYMIMTRAVVGLCIGFMIPLALALVFENFSDKKQQDTVIGWQFCASSLGGIVVTAVAGILALISYKAVFYVHLIGLIPFFGVLLLMPEQSKRLAGKGGSAGNKRPESYFRVLKLITPWLVFVFVYMMLLNCFATNISLLVEGSGIGDSKVSGFGASVFTIGAFLSGSIFGKLVGVTKKYTLGIGMLFTAGGLFMMAVAQSAAHVYISSILVGIGMSIVTPVVVSSIGGKVAPGEVTLGVSLYNAASGLGMSVTPYAVNYISSIFAGDSVPARYIMCAAALCSIGIVALLQNLITGSPASRET